MRTRKRAVALAAAALLIGGIAVVQSTAQAALSNPGGTSFEGNDANVAGAAILPNGGIDWANLVASGGTLSIGPDAATGQCDNSFTQGSKEDETAVVIGQGSIPNSKADLGQFAVGSLTLDGGPRDGNVLMTLAWVRNNLSGTTNFDFEINQRAQPSMTFDACPQVDRAINLIRIGDAGAANTSGGPLPDDLLISYDVQGGAQNPTLSFRRWTGTAWSAPLMINSTNSEGALNTNNVITTSQNGPFARVAGTTGTTAIPASMFGEGAIDLTALGIIPNQNDPNAACVAFGSAYVKSRASSSFTAQMKDYIAPIGIGLDTCGSIEVRKTTDTHNADLFDFTSSGPGALFDANFQLADGGSFGPVTGLTAGSYSVVEADPGPNYALQSATCDDGSDPANIQLGQNEDVICTFHNVIQRGNIVVDKITDPAGDPQSFDFVTTGDGYSGFSLTDAAVPNDSGPLLPGSYSVSETLPAGWTGGNSTVTCVSNIGDTEVNTALELDPNETITCTFNNRKNADITVIKQVVGPDPGQVFTYTSNFGVPPLANGGSFTSGDLASGPYFVTEDPLDNWLLKSATCAGDDDGTNPASITLDAGEHVVCTFVNEWQVGALRIHKEAKHAASETGVIGVAGVTFDVEDANGNVNSFVTDANGNICVDSWGFQTLKVTEQVPFGYANPNPEQDVVISEVAYCDGSYGVPAEAQSVTTFVNTPLTTVSVSVDSLIDGGTSSTVNCVDQDGLPIGLDGVTGANGDGSFGPSGHLGLDEHGLQVVTCTIVIDP